MIWQVAKGKLIQCHTNWIKSVLTQMKFVKDVIKGYKYLDEAIEFAKESGFALNDAELIRTNSTGLIMYNPKNAAEMLKSMKNKSQSREQKIAERIAYQQAQSKAVN
jgi:hemerythrin superfamily protein